MPDRGRPRTDALPRFNVDTHLRDNKKFLRFKRATGLDEKQAFVTLVLFLNYVAANYGIMGEIGEDDAEPLADFCWFEGQPADLVKALKTAGFVEPDGKIHDWHGHQPLAAKIARDRERHGYTAHGEIIPQLPERKLTVNAANTEHRTQNSEHRTLPEKRVAKATRKRAAQDLISDLTKSKRADRKQYSGEFYAWLDRTCATLKVKRKSETENDIKGLAKKCLDYWGDPQGIPTFDRLLGEAMDRTTPEAARPIFVSALKKAYYRLKAEREQNKRQTQEER